MLQVETHPKRLPQPRLHPRWIPAQIRRRQINLHGPACAPRRRVARGGSEEGTLGEGGAHAADRAGDERSGHNVANPAAAVRTGGQHPSHSPKNRRASQTLPRSQQQRKRRVHRRRFLQIKQNPEPPRRSDPAGQLHTIVSHQASGSSGEQGEGSDRGAPRRAEAEEKAGKGVAGQEVTDHAGYPKRGLHDEEGKRTKRREVNPRQKIAGPAQIPRRQPGPHLIGGHRRAAALLPEGPRGLPGRVHVQEQSEGAQSRPLDLRLLIISLASH